MCAKNKLFWKYTPCDVTDDSDISPMAHKDTLAKVLLPPFKMFLLYKKRGKQTEG